MKKSVLRAMVVLGTLVGVGLASGREVVTFFARFGIFGVVMAMVSAVLFSVIVYIELRVALSFKMSGNHCVNLMGVNDVGAGKSQKNYKRVNVFFDWVILVCNFIVMSAMIAGVFDLVAVLWGGSVFVSVIVLIGCFVCVVFGFKSLESVNRFFIPAIELWTVLIFLFCVFGKSASLKPGMWFGPGVKDIGLAVVMMLLYVGMNWLTILPIVRVVGGQVQTKKETILIALAFGVGVFLILITCVIMLVLFGDFNASMPTLMLARKSGGFVGAFYSFLILFGLITTLISTGFAVKQKINSKINDDLVSALICFVMGFVLSACGFRQIIDYFYPLIGVFGIMYIAIFYFKKAQK